MSVSTPNPDPGLPPTTTTAQGGDSIVRSYDAQNHLVSETTTLAAGAAAVCPGASTGTEAWAWGLEGHPWSYRSASSVNPPISLHWDGSALLYTTQANGTSSPAMTLFIGKLGAVQLGSDGFNAPYAISTIDRDGSGAQVQTHADAFFSAFSPSGAFLQRLAQLTPENGTTTTFDWNPYHGSSEVQPDDVSIPQIGMARTDGYQIGDVTIQGVRAYDPGSAQWTTPDAYAGVVTDPMSQQSYMWVNNNPIAYSDPSGYEAACVSLNQPCISRSGITSLVNLAKSIYNNIIGDDVRTLADKNASIGSKMLAAVMLISNFWGPEAIVSHGLEEIGVKSVIIETGNISKWGFDAAHTLPKSIIDDVLAHGEVIKGPDGYITARAQGRLNGTSGWFEVGGKSTNGALEVDHASFTRKNRIPGVIR